MSDACFASGSVKVIVFTRIPDQNFYVILTLHALFWRLIERTNE